MFSNKTFVIIREIHHSFAGNWHDLRRPFFCSKRVRILIACILNRNCMHKLFKIFAMFSERNLHAEVGKYYYFLVFHQTNKRSILKLVSLLLKWGVQGIEQIQGTLPKMDWASNWNCLYYQRWNWMDQHWTKKLSEKYRMGLGGLRRYNWYPFSMLIKILWFYL